jgi:hypothetical protein
MWLWKFDALDPASLRRTTYDKLGVLSEMLIHSLKGARIRLADAGFNLTTNAISRAQWLSLILALIDLNQ